MQLKPDHKLSCNSSERIVSVNAIDRELLEQIFSGEICAVRVPSYCSPELSSALTDSLLAAPSLECYSHEFVEAGIVHYLDYGVDRLGASFNTTYSGGVAAAEKYYRDAIPLLRHLRSSCGSKLSPFDRFRLELDEVWPGRVGLAAFEGNKMTSGMVRVMNRPKDSTRISDQPHVDYLPEKYEDLVGQFAVNIYISVPGNGGELELWDVPPVSREENAKITVGYDWRSKLPQPYEVMPAVGELIIFSTRRPHAVKRFEQGPRISVQSFIGLTKGGDLVLWA